MGATGFTDTVVVVEQPPGIMYVMVAVPVPDPVIAPVEGLIDATVVLLLIHKPPGVASLNTALLHMAVVPVIGEGNATINIGVLAEQPIAVVYTIEVVPADAPPDTTPVVDTTVAIAVFVQLHVPPGVASLSVVALPWHMVVAPLIGATGFTTTDVVTKHPPAVV